MPAHNSYRCTCPNKQSLIVHSWGLVVNSSFCFKEQTKYWKVQWLSLLLGIHSRKSLLPMCTHILRSLKILIVILKYFKRPKCQGIELGCNQLYIHNGISRLNISSFLSLSYPPTPFMPAVFCKSCPCQVTTDCHVARSKGLFWADLSMIHLMVGNCPSSALL